MKNKKNTGIHGSMLEAALYNGKTLTFRSSAVWLLSMLIMKYL